MPLTEDQAYALVRASAHGDEKVAMLTLLGDKPRLWRKLEGDELILVLRRHLVTAAAVKAQDGGVGQASDVEDHAMTAFFKSLPQVSLDSLGFLSLERSDGKERVYFPDDKRLKRSRLFVRERYSKLFDRVSSLDKTLLTGTPGIGKSWWIFYAIWKLQQSKMPPAIVWQTFKVPGRRVLFKDGKALCGTTLSFQSELDLESTWYFVDGVLPIPVAARTIMVSSPQRSVYKEFVRDGATSLVMPLWTKAELEACHKTLYQGFSKDRMDDLYSKYGGVIRDVLELPSLKDSKFDMSELTQALNTCKIEEVMASIKSLDTSPETSHRLLHMEPDEDFFLLSVGIASRYVAERIIERALGNDDEKVRSFLGALKGDNTWASTRGTVFEQLAHGLLSRGGSFPLCVLGSSEMERTCNVEGISLSHGSRAGTLALSPCSRQSFASTGCLANLIRNRLNSGVTNPLYLVPTSAIYPGIDSLLLPNCLFQMTIQQQRTFDANKVLATLDALDESEEYYFFFVVPDWVGSNFRATNIDTSAMTGRAARLKFFAITIDASPAPLSSANLGPATSENVTNRKRPHNTQEVEGV